MDNGTGTGSGGGGDQPISIPGLPNFTIAATDIGPPDNPTDIPRQHLTNYFRDAYTELRNIGVPGLVAQIVAGLIVAPAGALMVIKDLIIVVLRVVLPVWGGEVLDALDDIRKQLDSTMTKLAVDVLNELLGTDVQPGDLPSGVTFGDHLARADRVGGILHDTLSKEFLATGEVSPDTGRAAARRFSGLMINFGTATGVIATLGGLVPEIHLDEVREIGEQVAQNLGLGRLGRQALRPLVKALIEEPYNWWINLRARPTQLGIGEVVNPFSGSVMPSELIHDSLAKLGYSDDKIKALIELHQKKLSEADYFTLFKWGLKTRDDLKAYLMKLGYSDEDSDLRIEADVVREEAARQDELIATAIDAFKFGNISRDELQQIVTNGPKLPGYVPLTMLVADYKRKVPHRSLSVAELANMLETDVISLDEFDTYLEALGFSADDTNNLRIYYLQKFAKAAAAAAAKGTKAAGKTAKTSQTAAGQTTPTTGG